MPDKELIKQEVERLKMEYDKESVFRTVRGDTAREVFGKLLSFIDSLEEPTDETIKENYNERYKRIAQTEQFKKSYCDKSLGKEEPASEDLTHAAWHYANNLHMKRQIQLFEEKDVAADFIAGAEWQKNQMLAALQTAYEKGLFDMREEMMKDAIDATILDIDAQTIEFGLWPEKLLDMKESDKVKIIIIKEEQQ